MNTDHDWMAMALQLARRGRYSTHPNPRVGCVLVRDEICVGKGYHVRAGEPHAEIHALREAGEAARGATAYVTLEPCSHHGRTGPCADALIEAGIARLVVSMRDPNPLVAGRGIARIAAAGIAVTEQVGHEAAAALNAGFVRRMTTGRPYVRLKMAGSLDGRTALADGTSQWITGPEARADVQRLRAVSSAIVTGIASVLADDSRLTVRPEQAGFTEGEPQPTQGPWRVVLDTRLRIPDGANILSSDAPTLIVTCSDDMDRIAALRAQGVHVWQQSVDQTAIDLAALLERLAQELDCNDVLVEAGPTLAGAWIEHALVDDIILYLAPTLLGNDARPAFVLPVHHLSEQYRLHIKDIRAVGEDWKITAAPVSRDHRLS